MVSAGFVVQHMDFNNYDEWRVIIPDNTRKINGENGLNGSLHRALKLASIILENRDENELIHHLKAHQIQQNNTIV